MGFLHHRPHKQKQQSFVRSKEGNSLEILLSEAFACLENCFQHMDGDNTGVIMYSSFLNQLARRGFHDEDSLNLVWTHVDKNKSGSLDFSEFLSLMFLWAEVGTYENILETTENCELIKDAFTALQNNWVFYDQDKNKKFCYEELHQFMKEKLPNILEYSRSTVDRCFPPESAKSGAELSFPRFMYMLYCCFQELPQHRSMRKYVDSGIIKHQITQRRDETKAGDARGPESVAWEFLSKAFLILERDFQKFDKDGSGYIEYKELTMGIPKKEGAAGLEVLSRLEYIFRLVDLDNSKSIDFHEFLYLVFVMTRDGSYSDLVDDSVGHSQVGLALVHLHSSFNSSATADHEWLTLEHIESFCTAEFGLIPDDLSVMFDNVATMSPDSTEPVIDFLRFIRLLYFMTTPKGVYHHTRYTPLKQPQKDAELLVSIAESKTPPAHSRINPVHVSHFQKSVLLGKGTCGIVYSGVYDLRIVAAKFMRNEDLKEEALADLENEVHVMTALNHPNCHFLFGAKITIPDGGPIILTEVCEEGSLFEVYAKKQRRFDTVTSWRIGKECALGMEHLHTIGYMHRDLKSLNVFMTKNFTARIADFGFATNNEESSDPCGTIQWMAPEVLENVFNRNSSPYDNRCDIFSFGVLLWEIFHCRCPYSEIGKNQMVVAKEIRSRDVRPKLSERVPESVRDLIAACWDKDRYRRPATFSDVLDILEAIGDELSGC